MATSEASLSTEFSVWNPVPVSRGRSFSVQASRSGDWFSCCHDDAMRTNDEPRNTRKLQRKEKPCVFAVDTNLNFALLFFRNVQAFEPGCLAT